jgi:hypothetical protein
MRAAAEVVIESGVTTRVGGAPVDGRREAEESARDEETLGGEFSGPIDGPEVGDAAVTGRAKSFELLRRETRVVCERVMEDRCFRMNSKLRMAEIVGRLSGSLESMELVITISRSASFVKWSV